MVIDNMEDKSHVYLILQIFLLVFFFSFPFLLFFLYAVRVGTRRPPVLDNSIPPPLLERSNLKPSSSPRRPTHKSHLTKYNDRKPSSLRYSPSWDSDVTPYDEGAGGKILGDPSSF